MSDLASRSNEEKIARAFREGIKRAYGKRLWRELLKERGQETPSAYCRRVLRVDASAMSRGLSEGRIALEGLITLVVQLRKQMSDLPNLPEVPVLVLSGIQNSMAMLGVDVSIEAICCAWHMESNQPWQRLREILDQKVMGKQLQAIETKIADLERGIEEHANRDIAKYYEEYPDEFEHVPTRRRSTREYLQIWKTYGWATKECITSLFEYDWVRPT